MIADFVGKLRLALALLPGVLIAACDQGPAVVVNFSLGANVWDNFAYASKDGPVLVELHGNPIAPRPIDDLARMAVEEMKSAIMGRVVDFTVYPEEAPSPNIRIVVVFNAAKTQSGARLCAGAAPDAPDTPDPGGERAEKVTLRAVYCADGERMADVQGWIEKSEMSDDTRLRKLIWQATNKLVDTGDH